MFLKRVEVGKRRDKTDLVTYLHAGGPCFFQKYLHEEEKQPNEMGLIDSIKANLRIQTEKRDYNKIKTNNTNISLVQTDNVLLQYPTEDTTLRSTNKAIVEETKLLSFTKTTDVTTFKKVREKTQQVAKELRKKEAEVEERNNKLMEELEETNNRYSNRFIIIDGFKTAIGNSHRFMEEKDGTKLIIYAVKQVDTKFGLQWLLLASSKDRKKTKTKKPP
jgi:delta 1-pyrroline-5-carboxylate dehydrogenase